jgi:hypothetical protein
MGYGTDQALLAAEREIARSSTIGVRAVVLGFADFQIDRTVARKLGLPVCTRLVNPRSGRPEPELNPEAW